MLKFHFETEIKKPVEEVISLFSNRELMPQWQPGLVDDEAIAAGDGSSYHKLTYKTGRRNLVMKETILRNKGPHYDVHYELKGIRNSVHNTFKANGPGRTIWTSDVTFRFKGLMKLIGRFMKSGLEQQSMIIMKNFKTFAEHHR